MPELPDLVHLANALRPVLTGSRIREMEVRNPIVLRVAVPSTSAAELLAGRTVMGLRRHGPFLVFHLPPVEMVIHFMLAGRLQLAAPGGSRRPEPWMARVPAAQGGKSRRPRDLCFTVHFEDGMSLHYLDERRMGRVYLVPEGRYGEVPGFETQGVDVLSEAFSLERFRSLIAGRRCQLRVLLMDQSALSAIGNAYADEILFAARLHPKTGCHRIGEEEVQRLYSSVCQVLRWGIEEVEKAGAPLEAKVRGHLKVRNRKGEPCPVCGTTIRRVGVLGYDAFFCPRCQPEVPARGPEVPARGPEVRPSGRATVGRSSRIPWVPSGTSPTDGKDSR
jgi:formamidopyrimidine-DNA glycosylase